MHTKGKLTFHPENTQAVILAGDLYVFTAHDFCGDDVVPQNAEANARRLVACWNACDGFTTEGLEQVVADGETILKRLEDWQLACMAAETKQDTLLSAMKQMRPFIEDESTPRKYWSAKFAEAIDKYDSAIAAAENDPARKD